MNRIYRRALVRRLHNFIYCPRLFYFQWVENIFQESADKVAGSHAHRNVDAPSKLDDPKELGLPEGAKIRSLKLESEALGLVGVVDIATGRCDERARRTRSHNITPARLRPWGGARLPASQSGTRNQEPGFDPG
ncbi:MAG TPA: hypothetical protein VGK40_00325 [Verrucomicrobiae bacterium]|jgi:hypothetical protein